MNELTPGAVRAAERIIYRIKAKAGKTDPQSLAHIIEFETGLKELLEAVKALLVTTPTWSIEHGPVHVISLESQERLQAAIAKAEAKS